MTRVELERLYARLERKLFNLALRWLWDREEAMDVVQEAFVKLWKARAKVDAATADALAFRAVQNLARSRLRARRLWRWATLEPLRESAARERPADERLEDERLRKAIDALPDKLREVVLLCELSELRYDEAARILNVPMGTVASRRHKAVALLREALGEEGGDARAAVR